MSTSTETKPQAYQPTYDQLAPDMKRYVGVWVVPEGCEAHPFAAKIEELRQCDIAAEQAELAFRGRAG